MIHVGRKVKRKRHALDKRIHVASGRIKWERNVPEDVRRFEVIKLHNPETVEEKRARLEREEGQLRLRLYEIRREKDGIYTKTMHRMTKEHESRKLEKLESERKQITERLDKISGEVLATRGT